MRFLVADDHDLVREGIKAYLQQIDPTISVEVAQDFPTALRMAAEGPPYDLILLDFQMPGMKGIEGLERMRRAHPDVPLSLLSGVDCTPPIVRALRRLHASFVPKTVTGTSLLGLLQFLIDGGTYVPPSAMRAGAREDRSEQADCPMLTPRERQVLSCLLQGNTNKEIAATLCIAEVTVRLHLRGLFRKFGARNRSQVVKNAVVLGLGS